MCMMLAHMSENQQAFFEDLDASVVVIGGANELEGDYFPSAELIIDAVCGVSRASLQPNSMRATWRPR